MWTDSRKLQSSDDRVMHNFLTMGMGGVWTVELDKPPRDTQAEAEAVRLP